jgi:hypothetical protein
MTNETQPGMHCSEFEALLLEAVEGTLEAGQLSLFQAHARACVTCGPLFAEADAGRRWLKGLAEVEPPKNLVHNILARTTGVEEGHYVPMVETHATWQERWLGWVRPALSASWVAVRQPRFAMSMAMAFFSVSMALNVTGVRMSDLRKIDLRPSAIERSYKQTQGQVVKYYQNIRFVYDIQSKLRELKQSTTPAEPGPAQPEKRKDDNSSQKHQKDKNQERNYAHDETQPLLASTPDPLPLALCWREQA